MSILFVDDEIPVLHGLERMLDAADMNWNCRFANSGDEALKILNNENGIDTIVTDMQMPGMDGGTLLDRVSKEYPHLIRIVLSGQADQESVLNAVAPMHQFLSKPCDAEALKKTIDRARALWDVVDCPRLKQMLSGITSLPSVPAVYHELTDALCNEDITSEAIGEIIEKDPAMTAKILQIANSAVFGLRRKVESTAAATTFLGINMVKSLALTVGVFQQCMDQVSKSFSMDNLLNHSLQVAGLSRQIATDQGFDRNLLATVFTTSMLHDIGKLVFAFGLPEKYEQAIELARENNLSYRDAELQTMNSDHCATGAHLLMLWGLPQSIVEVVALHHNPLSAGEDEFSVLAAVSVANALVHKQSEPLESEMMDYLESIGCIEKLDTWRSFAMSQ